MNHGKIITTDKYYEGKVTETIKEMEESVFTDKGTVLKEVIIALSLVSKGETTKLQLEVCLDKHGRYRLIKRWVVQ